jgi:hypothetical protein
MHAREKRGRKKAVTGENCAGGGDGRVTLTASRRGRPAPPHVVAGCAAVETERSTSPSRTSAGRL